MGLAMVVAVGGHRLTAQKLGLAYTTEWQADFRRGTNWVNQLRTDFTLSLGRQATFELASISVAKTRDGRLADDLQTFSNIEEENIPLAPAVLGLRWQTGRSSWFVGVRNLNEDYFTSPCTSLFTNSSCGIFPTLSANYPLANYPLASVGADYRLEWSGWTFESSLYNGTAYRKLAGRENVFRFCPRTDGLLSVTSVNYREHESGYYAGVALRSRVRGSDEEGMEGPTAHQVNCVFWGYVEQCLSPHCLLLLQYSADPTAGNGCRRYAGGGLVAHLGVSEAGVFADYADFSSEHEWAAELTWKMPCLKKGFLQPALHVINNSREHRVIGLLRFGYVL